ncbi:inositol 1,4,5-trisphosphate/ryanodine receptor-domain-containing protein [Ochromonadaceae sp. CCMP2298]|nr:inositol 1,4,5-trisphosphate/ryanodine receptor-domain-containing protein [Ochromonadaceae sp. CCMP2298]
MSLSAAQQGQQDNFIRVGDLVTLKFLKHRTYLSAEGILVEDVCVSSSIRFFEEHLFQVYVQRQYSATNELEEFMTKDLKEEENTHMDALVRGKENESTLNRAVMKSKTGNVLYFGETIQLMHVKSGKFITVRPADLARDERENMKVTLSTDGSVMSWLKVMPRYKINREGEPITNNLEVVMKVAERSNEFLHGADRPPPRGKHTEVNSSLEAPTPWRLTLFQRVQDLDTALLLHGQLVCIRDPESQCVLAPITRPLQLDSDKRIKKENVVVLPGQNQFEPVWSESKRFRLMSESSKDAFLLNANGSHKGFNKGSSKFMESKNTKESDQDDGERLEEEDSESDHESVSSIDEFVLENGDVVFKPTTEADSDSLWVLESKNIVKGGPVRFRHEKVHFRHFNTGKYLSFHSQEDHPDAFRLRMNARPSEKGSTFNITQLHSAEENLLNGRAVQVKHAYFGLYLERGEHHSGQSVYPCEATRSKTRALSIILTRYAQAERKVLKAPTATEVWDVYFGHAVMHHVSKFVKATHIPQYSQSEVNTIWPKIDPADRGLFSLIVTRAALFVRGYPITAFNAVDTLSRMKPDKYAVAQRQDMLREQGLLRAMLNMLKLLKPISDSIISETAQASMVNRPRGYMDVGREVLAECLSLLYDLIKGNLGNQLYIADHLLVILAHVSTDKTAARVAQELLSSNRELQETKIGLREITIFADRMKEAPLNFMYLQLLQTCCSCLGEGLPKNQEIVHSVVFGSYKQEILVELREGGAGTWGATKGGGRIEESTKGCVDWGFGTSAYDLYIAPYAGKAQIRGEPLVFLLVPLYLTWKCGPLRNTPAKLFNVDLVPLWDLFRMHLPTSAKDKRRETIALQAMDSKRAVSEFFVAQLHLAAEMCLGRNYHVIHALEQLYSYEALVTILKSGGSNTESLKRAAAYLMLTLYVDRDPQSATPLPRLTRTLSEVRQSTGDELVRVEGARMYQFALLQGLISKHLMDVQQRSLGAHTYNMVQLLHSLVQFNFYGEVEKLKETISLLVACLRRDDSDLDHTQDSHILSSLMKLQPGGSAKRHSFKKPLTPSRSFADKDDKVEEEEGSMTPFPTTPFHTQALAYMEGPTANIGMVVFVLLSVAMALYYELTSVTPLYVLLDYAVYALFAAEFALHLFFHLMVHGTVAPFFCDPFNTMDLVALCAWVIVYTLRVSPFLKMVRLFRALRVPRLLELLQLHKLLGITPSALPDALFVWAEPERYQMTPESTVRTLVKVVQILCSVQGNIEDQQLSQVMQGYVNWASDPMSSSVEAQAIFREAGSSLCVSGDEVDDIYIDLLMYVHPSLVQATLELLVAHHSSRGVLLAHVQKLQLIDTEQGEEQYLRVVRLTTTLRRDADTHEIWGSLRTAEHRKINTDMYKFLNELTDYCRKRRDVLSFGEEFEPVVATQNILRNLGCFALCMKVVKLVVSIDKDDPFAEKHVNTRNLALLANKLLYWFVLDNPLNQTEAYSELQYLIKIVDAKVDAHKVIAGMFRNNLDLMETVPKKHIAEFVDLICTSGRFPQYLSLMSSILNVGEKNVIDNQYAIIKLIASPENAKKVVQFFCPVAAPAYQKKLQMMAPHLGAKDVSMDDLDSDLAYHLELMGLLSCCTVGRSGMTTIEAKVQSMYNFVDIVDAMLDPQALLLARIRSGLFLYNAMLDVETPLPALKDADCMWKLIISTQDVFMFAKDELRQIEKNGWDAPTSSRQKDRWPWVWSASPSRRCRPTTSFDHFSPRSPPCIRCSPPY